MRHNAYPFGYFFVTDIWFIVGLGQPNKIIFNFYMKVDVGF